MPTIVTTLRPAARVALGRIRAADRRAARPRAGGRGRRVAARDRRRDSLRRLPARRGPRVGRTTRQRARADHGRRRDWSPTSWARSAFVRSIISSSARASSPTATRWRRDADAVTLMTLHNAKGLEFPVVFITGLEDGLFPLAKAYDDPPLLEEERRLFYVGITRAERKLYLTHAEERRRNGELLGARQSSFLDGIPTAMLEKRSTIKVRSSGRSFMRAGGDAPGRLRARVRSIGSGCSRGAIARREDRRPAAARVGRLATARRARRRSAVARGAEDESQDAAVFAIGARVQASQVRQRHDRRAGGRGARRQGQDRLRRRGDRPQDARHRAGEPRARRRVTWP